MRIAQLHFSVIRSFSRRRRTEQSHPSPIMPFSNLFTNRAVKLIDLLAPTFKSELQEPKFSPTFVRCGYFVDFSERSDKNFSISGSAVNPSNVLIWTNISNSSNISKGRKTKTSEKMLCSRVTETVFWINGNWKPKGFVLSWHNSDISHILWCNSFYSFLLFAFLLFLLFLLLVFLGKTTVGAIKKLKKHISRLPRLLFIYFLLLFLFLFTFFPTVTFARDFFRCCSTTGR